MSIKIQVESEVPKKEPIFFRGNLVEGSNGNVVLVTGCAGTEHFSGIRLSDSNFTQSDSWVQDYFKQFTGKITLEASK